LEMAPWRSDAVVRGAIDVSGFGGTNASDAAAVDRAMMHEKKSFMVSRNPILSRWKNEDNTTSLSPSLLRVVRRLHQQTPKA